MAKFKKYFQRKVKFSAPAKLSHGSGAQAQLPPGYLDEYFFLLRRQFLYEKHLKAVDIEVGGYINMSLDELREKFRSYNKLMLNASGYLPEVLNEPSFEKRREIFLERKKIWTAKSPEEFDPRVCDGEAFDGFEEWLEKRKNK